MADETAAWLPQTCLRSISISDVSLRTGQFLFQEEEYVAYPEPLMHRK